MNRLRVPHKVLLGGALLLLPTAVLLYYFAVTVNSEISFTEREQCGLTYDAELRTLLRQATDPPPRTVPLSLDRLHAVEGRQCLDTSISLMLGSSADVDRLASAIATQDHSEVLSAILALRARVRDHSNLILDPDLDTYYVEDFLFDRFEEALVMLAAGDAPAQSRIDAHVARAQRGLRVAVEHNNYYSGSRHTLEPAIGTTRDRYFAALSEAGSAGTQREALDALFLLADVSAAWVDSALEARIDDRRQWKLRTYATVCAVLLLAAAFSWLAVRNTVRRLLELVSLSRRMSRGDLDLHVRVRGGDEIALLQDTFNTMSSELRLLYADMERRVDERTSAAAAAEARFRSVIEAAPDAILMMAADGAIVLVNSQLERLFGYRREELLGSRVEMLVPDRYRARHLDERRHFQREPSSRAMGAGRELFGRRKDGSEFPLEIGLSAMQTAEGSFVLASVIDITQRKESEKLIREADAHALRTAILQSLPASVIATDLSGTIVVVNPAAERMLGYAHDELIGRSSMSIHDPDEVRHRAQELSAQLGREVPPGFDVMRASISDDQSDEREWAYVRKDLSRVPVQVAITAIHDKTGRTSGYLQVAHDISARKRAEAYIHHMAYHDALTGLPNRALLLDRLGMALRQADRHQEKVAVLMLDLDHFKRINDSLGHHAGDQLLVSIADRLEHAVRSVDTVARLGGDEFVIVAPDVRSRADVEKVIAKLVHAVRLPLQIDTQELQVTSSLGGCLFPDDGQEAPTLLKKADIAMYQAKSRGRNTIEWFSEAMLLESREKLELSVALRHAIENEDFSIHYQAELSLVTNRVVGFEALLRWQRDGEWIGPDRFIPIAEESGLIQTLGEWALRRACFDCVRLQNALGRQFTVAVNVSPAQFQTKAWTARVAAALQDSGLHPNRLELEITESMLMQNPEETAEALREIRKLGVGIVLDDFGTGYSSLAYLTRFALDKIKIDRSFVRNLTTDSTDAAVIDSIIAMAQRLRLRVIAEGVELPEQQAYLRQRGCDEAQGFLYSKGLPIEDLLHQISAIEGTCSSTAPDAGGTQVA